ncbi:hypothetical protein FB451DRAFT_1300636 [Mycena latifolia]|nr:hypothetical protein FB451DRAFT_1300636 [Mycena latifolia]
MRNQKPHKEMSHRADTSESAFANWFAAVWGLWGGGGILTFAPSRSCSWGLGWGSISARRAGRLGLWYGRGRSPAASKSATKSSSVISSVIPSLMDQPGGRLERSGFRSGSSGIANVETGRLRSGTGGHRFETYSKVGSRGALPQKILRCSRAVIRGSQQTYRAASALAEDWALSPTAPGEVRQSHQRTNRRGRGRFAIASLRRSRAR